MSFTAVPAPRTTASAPIELVLAPDGKGSGTALPACKLTVDKKQTEVETYQNPWKLTNLLISKD